MDSKSHPLAHQILRNHTTTTQSQLTSSPTLAFPPQPHNPLSLAPTKQQLIPHHPHTQQQPTEYNYQQQQQSQQQFPESGTGVPQQQQQQQQPAVESYPHQVSGSGGPTATAPFLRDFSLVAEAAKRAQMSVVMRDLEAVTL